jgi:hypothetical protein
VPVADLAITPAAAAAVDGADACGAEPPHPARTATAAGRASNGSVLANMG